MRARVNEEMGMVGERRVGVEWRGGLDLGCNCPGNLVVRGKMKDRNRRQGNKQKDHQSVRDSK